MDFYIVAKALEKLQQVKLKYLLSPIKAKSEPTKKTPNGNKNPFILEQKR